MTIYSMTDDPADYTDALTGLPSGPAFGFQAVSIDDTPDTLDIPDTPDTLGIPAGVDGLVHEAPGVLRAVSKTIGADGIRHHHLLTYRWSLMLTGWRYVVLSCNCPCCWGRDVPACRHALLADTLLNHSFVKSYLLASRPGQTGPCEVVRVWGAKACFGCGAPTLYVHLYRPVEESSCRANDRKTVCTGCGLWRHES